MPATAAQTSELLFSLRLPGACRAEVERSFGLAKFDVIESRSAPTDIERQTSGRMGAVAGWLSSGAATGSFGGFYPRKLCGPLGHPFSELGVVGGLLIRVQEHDSASRKFGENLLGELGVIADLELPQRRQCGHRRRKRSRPDRPRKRRRQLGDRAWEADHRRFDAQPLFVGQLFIEHRPSAEIPSSRLVSNITARMAKITNPLGDQANKEKYLERSETRASKPRTIFGFVPHTRRLRTALPWPVLLRAI